MTTAPAPVAVIMAGGSGTRFWPASRAALPKQLVRIVGDSTMIQATVARLQPLIPADRVAVVTTAALAEETRRQLPMLDPGLIIAEPAGRDTAAAVALAAMVVEHRFPGAPMVLLPADQVITPADAFQTALRAGLDAAREGALVTFGIAPRGPATGYGYIQVGEALAPRHGCAVATVARFVEKPDLATATRYVEDGGYRWNSGIFAWRGDVVLRELAAHCPWLVGALAPLRPVMGTPAFAARLAEVYGPLRRISIDYALMEKAQGIQVVTGYFAWDDVGSWDSLYDHADADAAGLRARGDVTAIDCSDSLIVQDGGPAVAAVGLRGLTVVSTREAVLVVPRGGSQRVKEIVDRLKAEGRGGLL